MGKIPIRVLIAKPGLDGHDVGAKVLVQRLRNAGMEVLYTGLRQTTGQIISAAVQEDVDVIGLSCLSGAHMTLFPQTMELIRKKSDKQVLLVGGGIIPTKDVPKLKKAGFAEIFGPGTSITKISDFIKTHVGEK